MGTCPGCGNRIGPISIIVSWDNWGKFICPGCGNKIQFRNWLLTVIVLFGLFIGSERVLQLMLISQIPLWLSFTFSSIAAILLMFVIPTIWTFKKAE
jgi:hypothetical protein